MAAVSLSGVGSALRLIREARGLTKDELAKRVEAHPSTLSHWETGRNYPSWDSLAKILDALDASLLDLHYAIEGQEPPTPPSPVRSADRDSLRYAAIEALERIALGIDPDSSSPAAEGGRARRAAVKREDTE